MSSKRVRKRERAMHIIEEVHFHELVSDVIGLKIYGIPCTYTLPMRMHTSNSNCDDVIAMQTANALLVALNIAVASAAVGGDVALPLSCW